MEIANDFSLMNNLNYKYKINVYSPPVGNLPFEDISLLLKDAFAERLEAGLNFRCANYSQEDVKRYFGGESWVILAFDEENKPIGMLKLSIHKLGPFKFGTHGIVAVSSKMKGQGIGKNMFSYLEEIALTQNLAFIISDTAEQAISSVIYHEKMGFRQYAYKKYPNRTYRSLKFIKTYKKGLFFIPLVCRFGKFVTNFTCK